MLLFVLENAVHLIMAQGMRTFRDPGVPTRDRQLLKRELGSELVRGEARDYGDSVMAMVFVMMLMVAIVVVVVVVVLVVVVVVLVVVVVELEVVIMMGY